MPYEPESWKDLTPKQKKARAARFVSDPEDLVVIRLDKEARNEVAEAGRREISRRK